MTISRIRPVFERGRSKIIGQSIVGLATYLHQISLSRADLTHGFLQIANPDSGTVHAEQRRLTSSVYITDTKTDATAQSTFKENTSFVDYYGLLYVISNWAHKAYFHDVDSRLSDTIFQEQLAGQSTAGGIRLLSARINGSNIDIEFRNFSTATLTLTVDIEWRVEKVKHV